MNPVYSLPFSEFCVAQQLAKLLPATRGYSIFAPLSRQEKGVDLLVTRRRGRRSHSATVQVKSSRTYSPPTFGSSKTPKFRYYTWFNTFNCPAQADFFCLVALYPAVDAEQRRELGTWWSPVILLFTQQEMRRFLNSVKTKGGTRDRMFGFGFNTPKRVYQTRGDARRRFQEYSEHILSRTVQQLKAFLSADKPKSRRPAAR